MVEVFQVFELRKTIMNLLAWNLSDYACRFIKELQKKGYKVLVSSETLVGLPSSIIVVGQVHENIKNDFHEILRRIGLYLPVQIDSERREQIIDIYVSGEVYVEAKSQ